MKFTQTYCVVDHDLRILWVGGDWDEFAQQNGGPEAMARAVLSTSLTDHISDAETAHAMREIVHAVISHNRPLRLDYRCDAPYELRRFRMTVQPLRENRALIVHDLKDAVRLREPIIEWHHDPRARSVKCTVCCAVGDGADWVDLAAQDAPHPAEVSYALCPGCLERVAVAIAEVIDPETFAEASDGAELGADLEPARMPGQTRGAAS